MIANAPYKKRNFAPRDFMPGKKKQGSSLPNLEEIRIMNIAAGGDDILPNEDKPKSQEELKAIVKEIQEKAEEDGRNS